MSWQRLAIGSFAAALAWNAAAFAIDDSSRLEQDIESTGLSFGSVLATVFYGGVPPLPRPAPRGWCG